MSPKHASEPSDLTLECLCSSLEPASKRLAWFGFAGRRDPSDECHLRASCVRHVGFSVSGRLETLQPWLEEITKPGSGYAVGLHSDVSPADLVSESPPRLTFRACASHLRLHLPPQVFESWREWECPCKSCLEPLSCFSDTICLHENVGYLRVPSCPLTGFHKGSRVGCGPQCRGAASRRGRRKRDKELCGRLQEGVLGRSTQTLGPVQTFFLFWAFMLAFNPCKRSSCSTPKPCSRID